MAAPTVVSAVATSASIIQIQFDSPMLYDSELEKAANYTFSGPTTLNAVSVVATDLAGVTHVDVTLDAEMFTGGVYTAEANNIFDIMANPIAAPPNNQAIYVGVGIAPRVGVNAVAVDDETVRIVYDERVNNAEAAGPYSILPAIAVTSATKVIDDYTYELKTATQTAGQSYVISITNVVEDLAGNPINPAYDTSSFVGPNSPPPEIWMNPEDGSDDVRIRSLVSVTARDVEVANPGIDVTTLDLKVYYTIANGTTIERIVVEPGDLSYVGGVVLGDYHKSFTGKITGDPLDQETGVTFHFVPVENWLQDTLYTVTATIEDDDAPPNVNTLIESFRTDVPVCFEDDIPAPTALDTILIDGFPSLPNADKLRAIIMQHCSTSANQLVQARTLMHLATKTDMRTVLAGLFDYALVDDIQLCDRIPFLTVKQTIDRYKKIVPLAIEEIPSLTQTAKDMIMRYFYGNSPVYVVNAAALVVLLAAILGDA